MFHPCGVCEAPTEEEGGNPWAPGMASSVTAADVMRNRYQHPILRTAAYASYSVPMRPPAGKVPTLPTCASTDVSAERSPRSSMEPAEPSRSSVSYPSGTPSASPPRSVGAGVQEWDPELMPELKDPMHSPMKEHRPRQNCCELPAWLDPFREAEAVRWR